MKKYLAIVCTGNNTYHDFTNINLRKFDVCIIYFNEGKEDYFKSQSEYFFQRKSPKYKLIKDILPDIPWQSYKYIFLPDDDLTISIEDINKLFEIADTQKMELCQPSILLPGIEWETLQQALKLLPNIKDEYSVTPLFEIRKKYFDKQKIINRILYGCSYPILLKKFKEKIIRSVDLIEVQCPLMSKKFLEKIYPIITDPLVTTGFGLDLVWSQPGFVENKYVIDYISVIHMNETHFRQYEEFIKGKRNEKDVAEQYQNLKLNPMVESQKLMEKYNINNITIVNEAFEFYMDNDNYVITNDLETHDNMLHSMNKLLNEAYEQHIKGKIEHKSIKALLYTGDKYKKDINFKNNLAIGGTRENYDNLIPGFVFDSWKEAGIENYENNIKLIVQSSKKKWTDERVFWIGNCNSNPERWKYIEYNKTHDKTTTFKHIQPNNTNFNDLSKTSSFVSLEEYSKYRILLDGIHNGYSKKLPYLMSTGRPVIIHESENEQWFFYNNTFKPWIHYIPLKNISELDKIIKWTFDNKEECEKIGANGQKYVLEFLTKEQIIKRIADVLISKIEKKYKLDPVYCQIKKDISQFKYNRNTQLLMDIAISSTFKLEQDTLKVKITNNKMEILHKVKGFERRAEGIIKVIQLALDYGKIRDGIIYINVADEYIYQFPDLPFMIIAKPKDKKGILFVDNTFTDIEPETKTILDKSKMITWEDNKNIIDKKCDNIEKENKIFFIGQNINMKKQEFNMRKWLHDNIKKLPNIPFKILLTDKSGYMPMSDFCKYKYLLNLPGMSPWSFRFKFLFLMKSLIINVSLYRKYNKLMDDKWINIFDVLFIPNKDYIDISYYYKTKENQEENLNNLLNDIGQIYTILEKDNDFYNKITNNGYKKGKIINNKNISKIAYTIINSLCSKFSNIEQTDFKYGNFDYKNLIENKIKGFKSELIGRGVQGKIYLIKDLSVNYNFIIKCTELNFGSYDSYREVYFTDMINSKNFSTGFIKYFDTQLINNKTYMAMEKADGDLIKWSLTERTSDEWINFIIQIIIIIKMLQSMGIIHNDLQPKNILYKNQKSTIKYQINNINYQIKSNYLFYVADFGISVHPELTIKSLSEEEMNIKNFDLKKFSHTIDKLKTFNIKEKYTLNELMNKFKEYNDKNYLNKLNKLKEKTKNWKIDNEYKTEYIYIHMCYNYVKNGYFNNNDYVKNAPAKIPVNLEKIFIELRSFKQDLNEWLVKYIGTGTPDSTL